MFAIRCIDDGLAADFGYFFIMSVESPTAYLSPAHYVFDELDSAAETHREFVKQFDVLQKVVVRVAAQREGKNGR